ncbi:MAG: phosphate signaling complex protein PhoU [Oscillospiraceae bacterium]|nr:phosphate signaling complex protein PhoU [Oscillospiraceae bacterium]MCD7934754.1 phosphate signaling complex protein PhoU [Oscillospiraceae bacterium]
MRTAFDGYLWELSTEMADIGALCEEAIDRAARSFLEGDLALAETLPGLSCTIDRKEREIESMCLKLLMRQQPVASDLRIISAALKMVTDMERIGNQSADIAEIVLTAEPPANERTGTYQHMALSVIRMVSDSVDAFLQSDAEKARAVIAYDDVVDKAFDDIKHQLIDGLRSQPQPSAYTVDLLMISKYLEHIGDHAVNIGKWVVFSVTGEIPK